MACFSIIITRFVLMKLLLLLCLFAYFLALMCFSSSAYL
jgi:hypothetical protein